MIRLDGHYARVFSRYASSWLLLGSIMAIHGYLQLTEVILNGMD